MRRQDRRKEKKKREFFLPNVVVPASGATTFSFKHLDRSHTLFPVESWTLEFWDALAMDLHRYSNMSFDDFLQYNDEDNRHFIDFTETNCPEGLAHIDPEELYEGFQFRVGKLENPWRVIGFGVNGTFYIVWLDCQHRLYERGKR